MHLIYDFVDKSGEMASLSVGGCAWWGFSLVHVWKTLQRTCFRFSVKTRKYYNQGDC